MLYPQNLFDELASDAGAEQHADDHPIQEVLNLRHALVPITQGSVDTAVSFTAYGFMHGELSLHCFHLQPSGLLVVLRLLAWLELTGIPLGMGVCPNSQEVGLLFQLVVAVSCLSLLIVV